MRVSRPVMPRVVFCVEGRSEREYLDALRRVRYDDRIAFHYWSRGSKSSLRNLVEECQRRRNRGEDPGEGLWIVGDTDENVVHRSQLESWLTSDELMHHAALTDPCLELWLLLHYTDPARARDAHRAEAELVRYLPGYRKGHALPDSLIERTEEAMARMHGRVGPGQADGLWPGPRVSQLPALIGWLDQLVRVR